MKDRHVTDASQASTASNWLSESAVVHFKIFALSLVCAVIGPAAAVVLFVLVNNTWG